MGFMSVEEVEEDGEPPEMWWWKSILVELRSSGKEERRRAAAEMSQPSKTPPLMLKWRLLCFCVSRFCNLESGEE